MPLLGNSKLDEYQVTMTDGMDTWTEFVLAPNFEQAAWLGFELSGDRKAQLKDVIRSDEWT